MTDYSTFHAHSTLSDGENSPEEMVVAAIDAGCAAFGLSEHAHTPHEDFSLSYVAAAEYRNEIERLRRKYSSRIDILIGIEQDILSDTPTDGYDYVIGATHSLYLDGNYLWVDASVERLIALSGDYFGGDLLSVAEAYFALHSRIHKVTKCDIVAHFDLIAKFNDGDCLFDSAHPRYRVAAIDAMSEILKDCNVFEVNTGAMYRSSRSEPYPAVWLLRELRERGGEVILSSDAHDVNALLHRFRETEQLLRSIGFRHRKTLSRNGFTDIDISA